jgi:hypothetical protein
MLMNLVTTTQRTKEVHVQNRVAWRDELTAGLQLVPFVDTKRHADTRQHVG